MQDRDKVCKVNKKNLIKVFLNKELSSEDIDKLAAKKEDGAKKEGDDDGEGSD
jgi:hypothetical protein